MTILINHSLGSIFDHYADVIEGGNTYNSGTSMRGIPGRYSNDLNLSTDSPLVIESIEEASFIDARTFRKDRWISSNSAPYFVVSGSEHRKIINYNASTRRFSIQSAFSTEPSVGSSLTVLQGFKRVPNQVDIESDVGAPDGFDRSFHLSATSGKVIEWFGAGNHTYETMMTLRLRILKFDRLHDWSESAFTNLCILRSALTLQDHRESTYSRALFATDGEQEIAKEDNTKIVVLEKFRLLYRVSTDFDSVNV